MRNFLATLAVLTISFFGVGAWRGWYTVSRETADLGKYAFRIEIDAIKVGNDVMEVFRSFGKGANKDEPRPEESLRDTI